MPKPLVSILIVNFNGGEVFKKCLQSLKKLQYQNYEIIIFDNGSSDGTQKLATVKSTKNLGFVGGNNEAFKKAKGKYILLLNNDTTVSPNLLDVVVAKMERDKTIGVLQPKIYLMDKPNYLDNAGSFLNTFGFTNHWGFLKKDSKEFDNEREIFSAKGACLMTRKNIIEKIGLFDSDYFNYFEESDFCWRVWLAGWRVIYFPKTFIYHKLGYTSRMLSPIDVNFHSLKNRLQSFIKNFELFNLIIYGGTHVFVLVCLIFVYLLELEIEKAAMVEKAIWWNILNFRKSLRKRKQVQKYRKLEDKVLLAKIMQSVNIPSFISHFFATEKSFK